MRDYLKEIEIVGITMVYQEGEICRWSLDWLFENCDRVCIVLDNWNKETEDIVMEYKNKYPDRTRVAYSDIKVEKENNEKSGFIKIRFVFNQGRIRNFAAKQVREMHEEKPIDMLIWPDSDETFIDEFPRHLENFWNSPKQYMVLGFIQLYDNFQTIFYPRMFPHGRVYKYTPELDTERGKTRCLHYPYCLKRGYLAKNTLIHVCALNEKYRKQKEFTDNMNFIDNLKRINAKVWILPQDVRRMKASEIAEYNQAPRKYEPISFHEYIENKEKYDAQLLG